MLAVNCQPSLLRGRLGKLLENTYEAQLYLMIFTEMFKNVWIEYHEATKRIKFFNEAAVYPLLRKPLMVGIRGSSHPETVLF